jgi:hypothetical protein
VTRRGTVDVASQARRRRIRSLRLGNVNALEHGVRAQVQNARDVRIEIGLTFATHPALDPIVDRRLVEQLAVTRVQRQRVLLAMATEGFTSILTSYDARLAPLEERLDRAVRELDRQRRADLARSDRPDRWQPRAVS